MAVNDIYMITDQQRLYGQQVLNVYFYTQSVAFSPTAPTIAENLASAFLGQVIPDILAVQTGDLVHTGIVVRNLFNASDQFELPISLPGTDAGAASDTISGFEAIGFELAGSNAAVRNGQKRIAGLAGSAVTDGVITSAGHITLLNTLCAALEDPILDPTTMTVDTWFPCVVKRVRSGAPGSYEYRLPENLAESVISLVVDVLFDVIITSQVSRKIGIGA